MEWLGCVIVVYLDKNSVPELLLKFELEDNPWIHGALYTYKNGRVKFVSTLANMYSLRYYKKRGIIVDVFNDDLGKAHTYKIYKGSKLTEFQKYLR